MACHTQMLQALCSALSGFLGLRSLESYLLYIERQMTCSKMTDALDVCPRLALSSSPPASFSQVLGSQVCATTRDGTDATSGDVRSGRAGSFGTVASRRESIPSLESLGSFILLGPEIRVFIFFRWLTVDTNQIDL